MFKQYIMTDLKNETVWKILDESVGLGSVPLFIICHIHFPHCFKIRFQSFTAFVLVDNCFSTIFFLLPYQNFACPVLKSKIHNEVELKMYYLSLQNIFQSIAANLIQGKLFSHFSRIFFLLQMCYHTLPTESFWQTFVEDRHMISIKTTLDGCSFLATSFPGFCPTLPPGDELDRALGMRLLSRDCFAIVVLCQKSRKILSYTQVMFRDW